VVWVGGSTPKIKDGTEIHWFQLHRIENRTIASKICQFSPKRYLLLTPKGKIKMHKKWLVNETKAIKPQSTENTKQPTNTQHQSSIHKQTRHQISKMGRSFVIKSMIKLWMQNRGFSVLAVVYIYKSFPLVKFLLTLRTSVIEGA